MNFSFRSYPSHAWLPDWSFETRNCGISFREMRSGYFFQAGEMVGQLYPQVTHPEWTIQIPLPQNGHTNILFNGFCGYLTHKKKQYAAEALVVEPGVLRGQFNDIPAPQLVSELPIVTEADYQWIDSDKVPALLVVQGADFCLVTKQHLFEEARKLAAQWMNKAMDQLMSEELRQRNGASRLLEHLRKHDSLAVISAESLMRALRPPEDRLTNLWSKSPHSDTPRFDVNEVYALVQAWKHLDPLVSEQLLLTALKLQAPSGAIPVNYSPHETFSTLEAPKPLLAKACEQAFKASKRPEFLKETVPLLRRHIQWLLHHFDPKRRGWHHWQNKAECLAPEHYRSEIATADLTVLLLTEIDALNRLRGATTDFNQHPSYFASERETLESNLLTQFWNEEKSQFSNAFHRGKTIAVEGIAAFLPTLWPELPARQKAHILDAFKESGSLPGGYNILSWRKSTNDEDHAFPLLQQVLTLEGLKIADPNGQTIKDFSRLMLETFIEWHQTEVTNGRIGIDPSSAAYILNLVQTRSYRFKPKSKASEFFYNLKRKTKTDRNDLIITGAALAIAGSLHLFYKAYNEAPAFDLVEGSLITAYTNRDIDEVLKNSAILMKYYPKQAALAQLYTGNILLLNGKLEESEALFRNVRASHPDCPAAMISLGLILQQKGAFEEANQQYGEFTYLFDEIFPDLVNEVKNWRYLLREHFKIPPHWESIYEKYTIMHELGE